MRKSKSGLLVLLTLLPLTGCMNSIKLGEYKVERSAYNTIVEEISPYFDDIARFYDSDKDGTITEEEAEAGTKKLKALIKRYKIFLPSSD